MNIKLQETASTIPVLGITIGEDRWLVSMNDIGEILPVPKITSVFLTQPWFLGAIHVRGKIYGLSDLACYLTHTPTQIGAKNRIFLISSHLGTGYALLAGSILGIRNLAEFTHEPSQAGNETIMSGIYNDRQGRSWRMLNLSSLMQIESFLQPSR